MKLLPVVSLTVFSLVSLDTIKVTFGRQKMKKVIDHLGFRFLTKMFKLSYIQHLRLEFRKLPLETSLNLYSINTHFDTSTIDSV